MRLGQEFTAYAGAIKRAKKSLQEQSELLREIGLGGSAVGTGINTHPDYRHKAIVELSRISGQKLHVVDDMRYAMQSNLAMSSVSSALRNLALEVIRISNDLRLLASGPNTAWQKLTCQRCNWLVDHAGQDQSRHARVGRDGLLPGCRLRHGRGARSAGWSTGTECHDANHDLQRAGIHHDHDQYAAPAHDSCIKGITVNEARTSYYVQSTVSLATALNPYIGYAKAAEIAKESVKTGKSIIEIAASVAISRKSRSKRSSILLA